MAEPTGMLLALRCGTTERDEATLLQGAPHRVRTFPSTAFLWSDGTRRVLFDTGYAPDPWPRSVGVVLYRRLLPSRIGAEDTLDARLRTAGIAPASVTHIVLSHLHPDHVGGVGFVPDAELVVTAPVAALLDAPRPSAQRLRAGALDALLVDVRRMRRRVVDAFPLRPPALAGLRAADLFGDGRLLLVDLPGHARGHVGLFVEGRALLAGDAAWSGDLLGREDRLRLLPRLVAADRAALVATASALRRVEDGGVRLLFSHDSHPEGVDLLRDGTTG